jgi:hypothetical protein
VVIGEERGDGGARTMFEAASEKETRLVRRGDGVGGSDSSRRMAALVGGDGVASGIADDSGVNSSSYSSTI